VFDTVLEAKVVVVRWRRHYGTVRPERAGLPTFGVARSPALLPALGWLRLQGHGRVLSLH